MKHLSGLPWWSVAKTPCLQWKGPRLDSWSGNCIPHAVTKTQCSQIKHNKKIKIKKKSLKLQSALESNNGRELELCGKRAILDRAVEKASIGRLHFSDALKEAREEVVWHWWISRRLSQPPRRGQEWVRWRVTCSENSMKASVARAGRKPSCRRRGERPNEGPDHAGPHRPLWAGYLPVNRKTETTTSKPWIGDNSGSDQNGTSEDGLRCSYMNLYIS